MPQGFTTLDGVDFNEVFYGTLLPVLDVYNTEGADMFRDLLTAQGDEKIKKLIVPSSMRLQKTAFEETPNAVKITFGRWQALVENYKTGHVYQRSFLMYARMDDIERLHAEAIAEDNRTIKREVLFETMNDPAVAPTEYKGALWNGYYASNEGISTPPKWETNSFSSTHNHYVTSGGSALAEADFDTARQHMTEHGVAGQWLCYMHTNQGNQLSSLLGITGSGIASSVKDELAMNGYLSRFKGWDVFVTDQIPSGYVLWTCNQVNGRKLAAFVESDNASFRGFSILPGYDNPSFPLIGAHYERNFNIKVLDRSAAVAMQITTSASYTNPFS